MTAPTVADLNRLAATMWKHDGEPDGTELGEANQRTYKYEVIRVMNAATAAGWDIKPDTAPPPIFGRDRHVIELFAKMLHAETKKRHNYGPLHETARGFTFETQLIEGGNNPHGRRGEPTGHVALVTVELDRFDSPDRG